MRNIRVDRAEFSYPEIDGFRPNPPVVVFDIFGERQFGPGKHADRYCGIAFGCELGSVEIVAWLATASDMLKLSQQSPVVGKKPLLLMLMLASGIDASRMGSDTHQIFAMAFGKTDY